MTHLSAGTIEVLVNFQYAMMAVSVLGLGFIVVLIALEKGNTHLSWKQVANPFNLLLVTISLLQLCLHSSVAFKCWTDCAISEFARYVVEDVSIYGIVQAYILYSWLRGWEVLRKISPRLIPYFQGIMRICPVIYGSTIVADVATVWYSRENADTKIYRCIYIVDTIVAGLSGLIAVVFDLVMLITFVKYLRQLKADGDMEIERRLKIIAQFGTLTSLVAIIAFIFDVSYIQFPPESEEHIILSYTALFCIDLIVCLLIVMKGVLLVEKSKPVPDGTAEATGKTIVKSPSLLASRAFLRSQPK
ncbi:hypothetical protein HDU79_011145 [Rhizoclosmatium sp. JEL0117]|nr:hypothetical protein HDU79_011145 [Rhizoclosmatium sp. JEL0117]